MTRWLHWATGFCAAVLLLLWAIGCWRYTSVGYEFDTLTEGVMREDYYRVRWPGDGSVWVGSGWVHLPTESKALEPFDLGAVFFREPRVREPQTRWNQWGFWRISNQSPAELPILKRQGESWWGVPGWLPGLMMALAWTFLRRRQKTAGCALQLNTPLP